MAQRGDAKQKPEGDASWNHTRHSGLCLPVCRATRSVGIKRKAMDTSPCSHAAPLKKGPSPAAETPLRTVFPVPLEILEEIFLNLPPHQVVRVCRLVCRQWKEVADSNSLWIQRCRKEGYQFCDSFKTPSDWRLFYFLCAKRRNLLKNPSGEEGLRHWEILQNGGDRWVAGKIRLPHPDKTVQTNFATSFRMCLKMQCIDLEAEGYSPSFMDQFQPDIRVSDWYTPRADCGCQYEINVDLLSETMCTIQTFTPERVYFEQWTQEEWHQMSHVFRNYGPGVRHICFTHGGKDTQFWKGWYGIHITDSCVDICPALNI